MNKLTQTERAQRCVLPLEQSVYQATRANRGSVGAISEIHGESYDTLIHQVNPNRKSHTLAPQTIEYVIQQTQDIRIAESIAACYDNVGFYYLPTPTGDNPEIMNGLGEVAQQFGNMSSEFMAALADGRIDHDEIEALRKVCHTLMGGVQSVLALAEQKMEVMG